MKEVTIEKGQLIRSYRQMSEGIGLSMDQVRYSLDFLSIHSYIFVQRRGTRASLITVYAEASQSLCQSLSQSSKGAETLENKGKTEDSSGNISQSFPQSNSQSSEKDGSDGKTEKIYPKGFPQSLNDAESLENTGKTDSQADGFSQRFFPPYEKTYITKGNVIKENTSRAGSGESVDNPEQEKEIVNTAPGRDRQGEEQGAAEAVVTLTRESVCEVTRDPREQIVLLELIEANNGDPLTIRRSLMEKVLAEAEGKQRSRQKAPH